jgi:hypothetical protein
MEALKDVDQIGEAAIRRELARGRARFPQIRSAACSEDVISSDFAPSLAGTGCGLHRDAARQTNDVIYGLTL